jgi:PAT family beta-lactamase induction signal transducer AmpG
MKASLSTYFEKNIFVILLLGISSGLPLSLVLSTLSTWLTEEGISKSSIGLFSALTFPYTIKFLWSPLIDRTRIPILTKLLGTRRAWILVTQIALMLSIAGLGLTDPKTDPWIVALFALIVSFCSASQDIVIDAFRTDSLAKSQYPFGMGAAVFGYRIGMLITSAGALLLADNGFNWHQVYFMMSGCVIVGILAVLLAAEPSVTKKKIKNNWFKNSVKDPFSNFIQRKGWMIFIILAVFYKLGDAFAGSMAYPFYIELGFSKTDIAYVSKVYGLFATLGGAFVGGFLLSKVGLYKALVFAAALQLISNIVFIVQAEMGANVAFLMLTIGFENFSGGIGDAAFIGMIGKLCDKKYSATQFALLSSMAALGRTFLRTPSGYIAENLNWLAFFYTSAFVALPGIIILLLFRKLIRDNIEK